MGGKDGDDVLNMKASAATVTVFGAAIFAAPHADPKQIPMLMFAAFVLALFAAQATEEVATRVR